MKKCPKCGIIHENSVLLCDCGYDLNRLTTEEKKQQNIDSEIGEETRKEKYMDNQVKCQQCGSVMDKTTITDNNLLLQVLGVILFIVGIALLFAFPIGTVIGIFLMIGAARLGYKRTKVQKCSNCGYYFKIAS